MDLLFLLIVFIPIPMIFSFFMMALFVNSDFYSLFYLSLIIYIFIFLIANFAFIIWVRFFLKRLTKEQYRLSKMISSRCSNKIQIISFTKEDSTWKCVTYGKCVPFELTGCVFKKSFLLSFVIRAIRYPIINNGLPARKFTRLILGGFPKK